METLAQYLEIYIEHEIELGNIIVDADMLQEGIDAYESIYDVEIIWKKR